LDTSTAQNLTTIAGLMLAVGLAHIAASSRRYERFGREALFCASAFIFAQAVTRTLSINDYIDADTARLVVGMSALTALAILIQIGFLRHINDDLRKKE